MGSGDCAVPVMVSPGVVVLADGVDPGVVDKGNVGTGGRVDNCKRGATGGFNAFNVCAACDGRGYVVVPTLIRLSPLAAAAEDASVGIGISPLVTVSASFISTS